MNHNDATDAMYLPRFQVRTLLVITTIVALLVAWFAPWLRLVDAEIGTGVFIRCVCFFTGALWASELHKNITNWQPCRVSQADSLSTIRSKSALSAFVGIFTAPTLALIVFREKRLFALQYDDSLGIPYDAGVFMGLLLSWLILGFLLVIHLICYLRNHPRLRMTHQGIVSYHGLLGWERLERFEWLNRAQGTFWLGFQHHGGGGYQVPIAKAEALDAFLKQKLAENQPPHSLD